MADEARSLKAYGELPENSEWPLSPALLLIRFSLVGGAAADDSVAACCIGVLAPLPPPVLWLLACWLYHPPATSHLLLHHPLPLSS